MSKGTKVRQFFEAVAVAIAVLAMTTTLSLAQEAKAIQLSKPDMSGGISIMQAFSKRMSSREFSPEPVPVGVLSNLLWAGFGINRPDGRRTAPSAVSWFEIDIYVILSDGLPSVPI